MIRIVLVISILLLSSCGYHGCIKPQHVLFDEDSTAIMTGLEDGGTEHVEWVKSNLILLGLKTLTFRVDTVGVNFCTNEKRIVHVFSGNEKDSKDNQEKKFKLGFSNIVKGEKLVFRLVPTFKFTVDNDVCENKNPRIHVQNFDKCKSGYLNENYYIFSDNHDFPTFKFTVDNDVCENKNPRIHVQNFDKCKSGYLNENDYIFSDNHDFPMNNMMYLENKTGSSTKDEKRHWINFPDKIIYHMSTEQYNDFIKKIDNKDDSNINKINEEFFYVCATDKDLDDRASKDADAQLNAKNGAHNTEKGKLVSKIKDELLKKREDARKEYSKHYESYAINMICGNLCGIPGYNGKKVSENCFVTEKINILDSCFNCEDKDDVLACSKNADYKNGATGLPFIYLGHNTGVRKFITVDDTVKNWESNNENFDSVPLLTNHPYSFDNSVVGEDLYLELRPPAGKQLTGQYKIEVSKDCTSHVKDSLYYVISKGTPKVKPGDAGTKKIDFIDNKDLIVTLTDKDAAGELYFGVKDNGDGYKNNTGYFKVLITAKKRIPNIISYIVERLKGALDRGLYGTSDTNSGAVHIIYNNLIQHTHFIKIVNSLLVLYILISVLFYCVGFSRSSIFDLLMITLKISMVIYVINPDSWKFFNDHLFKLFTEAPTQLIGVMTGQNTNESTSFEFLDLMLYRFSLSETWLQILALLFTGPIGWVSVVLIFWGLVVLFLTIATAIITYLISIVLIGLLLSIAPFFVICILFKRTKAIFDAWIKSLVQTAMQPVIIFASFALLTEVIDSVIYSMFNFESCDACVIQPVFDIGIMKIPICLLEFLLPLGISPLSTFNDSIKDAVNTGPLVFVGLPMPIVKILIFVILVNATKHFVGSSGEMCTSIFGSFANLSMVAESAKESALGIIGMDQNSRMQRARYKEMSSMNNKGSDGERKRDTFESQLPDSDSPRQSRGGVSIPENPPSSFDG